MMRWLICMPFLWIGAAKADVILTPDEIAQTLSFGPWPPEIQPDISNKVSGDSSAIALGAALFTDPILSPDGGFTCASCHDPAQGFTVLQSRAAGRAVLNRNSPSLWNLSGLRWFGWGGKSDNLWAASLHPIIAEIEMGHTVDSLAFALTTSRYRPEFEALFGPMADQSSQAVLVNTAKTLAAYQETLVTNTTPFDVFRDALDRDDIAAAAAYPEAAQRGLQFFLDRGNCSICHSGPRFSNNEFHDAGVPYFLDATTVDAGRFQGLKLLQSSPYTLAGEWNDDADKSGAWVGQNVRQTHADFGTFRTPGLRGIAETAPYMHNGSLPDLASVVRHYNEIDLERMHAEGEAILLPLDMTNIEMSDLVEFLESLSELPN